MPERPAQYLAFDPGRKRVGVASGNTLTARASPLTTLAINREAPLVGIERLVAEWQPDALVVGVPRHPDGTAHVNTRRALGFAHALRERFGLPVHPVDERYSTVEAEAAGGESGVDARAAAVILDQFFADPTQPLESNRRP